LATKNKDERVSGQFDDKEGNTSSDTSYGD